MDHPTAFKLPPGGSWRRYQELDLRQTQLYRDGHIDDGEIERNSYVYVFDGCTRFEGDLALDFGEIDESDDQIYAWLDTVGIDQDSATVNVLGDLHVVGELRGSAEDPHSALYVEGNLRAGILANNHARVCGDAVIDSYQFVDDGSEFRAKGKVHAQAIFLEEQAPMLNTAASGGPIYGGHDGLPLKPALLDEFAQLDYPLYEMLQAAKAGKKVLRGEES